MEDDPDEEEMDNFNLDNERERHWRMVFKDNDGGLDNSNAFIHTKIWCVYVNKRKSS